VSPVLNIWREFFLAGNFEIFGGKFRDVDDKPVGSSDVEGRVDTLEGGRTGPLAGRRIARVGPTAVRVFTYKLLLRN
jgi:hypothetical protein